jgi:hypothetical protein
MVVVKLYFNYNLMLIKKQTDYLITFLALEGDISFQGKLSELLYRLIIVSSS